MATFGKAAEWADRLAAQPEAFFDKSDELAVALRRHLKHFGDAALTLANARHPTGVGAAATPALPELYVDGFTSDQIWQELALSVNAAVPTLVRSVKQALHTVTPHSRNATVPAAAAGEGMDVEDEDEEEEEEEEDGDEDEEVDSEEDGTEGEEEEDGEGTDDGSAGAGSDSEEGEGMEDAGIDDADMEAFVREGDEYMARVTRSATTAHGTQRRRPGGRDDDGSVSSQSTDADGDDPTSAFADIDFNAPLPLEGMADEDEAADAQPAKSRRSSGVGGDAAGDRAARLKALLAQGPRFEDMYGPRSGGRHHGLDGDSGADSDDGEGVDTDEEEDDFIESGLTGSGHAGRGSHADAYEDEDEDEGEGEGEGEDEGDGTSSRDEAIPTPAKASKVQRQREQLAATIRQLEEEAVAEKHWSLVGEVTSTKRPVNSLLAADLEYAQATKLVPEVTLETTTALEDLIKQRISDGAFDDPTGGVEAPAVSKGAGDGGALPVSQEKSKLGLGDLYAQLYEHKVMNVPADDPVARAEAEAMEVARKLFHKLDALTNFHYTPKPPSSDMDVKKIVAPAVTLEEVLPVVTSTAVTTAPEEVYASTAPVLKTRGEMSQAERVAARRQKKAAYAAEHPTAAGGGGRKGAGEADLLRGPARVIKGEGGDDGGSRFATSTSAFAKLQETRGHGRERGGGKEGVSKGLASGEVGSTKPSAALKM